MWARPKKMSQPFDKKNSLHLCFGIIEAYCPLISKKVAIKPEWIPKNMRVWRFWRISKKIKQKRLGLLSLGIILQHNNATSHWSKTITAKITVFVWSVFLHPAKYPDQTTTSFQNQNNFWEIDGLRMRKSWKHRCWNGARWCACSFRWMEWTNCFRATKNVSIGVVIMWKNKDYRTLSLRSFW